MTGLSPTVLKFPLQTAWQFKMMEKPKGQGEMLVSSPVVRGGKVYAGCKDGKFFCLELATGKELWKAEAKGAFDGAAAFAGELVVAGCQDGFVYAWNADTGKEAWKFETEAEIHAAANVWTDPETKTEHIIIGSYDYNVYSLNAKTGAKEWAAETGYYINGGAAVGDGKVVFGGCDSVLHVHDVKTGKEERQIEVGAYIGNNVAIADGLHEGDRVVIYDFGCVRAFAPAVVASLRRLVSAVRADDEDLRDAAFAALGAAPPRDREGRAHLRTLLRGFFAPLLIPGPRPMDPGAMSPQGLPAGPQAAATCGC